MAVKVLPILMGFLASGCLVNEAAVAHSLGVAAFPGDSLRYQVADLDFSKLVLTPADLPESFEELPPQQVAQLKDALVRNQLQGESLFAFQDTNVESFAFIMGFTVHLETETEQTTFDSQLTRPDFMEQFVAGFESGSSSQVVQSQELKNLNAVGEIAAGLSALTSVQEIPMRMDVVGFRRGQVGAFIYVMYLDGSTPALGVDEVARKFDGRLIQHLPASESLSFLSFESR